MENTIEKAKREELEIMAPAGSWESLQAAIQAGAGSVYFGAGGLNMRSKSSSNFTIEDLREIVKRCKANDVKTYLTINSILFDEDIPLMRELVDAAKQESIDAIITADLAAMTYAKQIGVEIHLSTQMNITNLESLRFFAQFADVVVLARELTLEQVASIYEAIQQEKITGPSGKLVRIEMFCHGALCMAVSSKCYLSLHDVNRSANRGSCIQECRRSYIVTDKQSGNELEIDNEYIMSPKDLKTIHFLNKLIDAGVRVFKLEGRARSGEYVKTVVRAYKEAIDAIYEGTYGLDKIVEWDRNLSKVFNRGFWDGHYLGQRLGEWSPIYGSSATHKKVYVATCTNYFSKLGVAEFKVDSHELSLGEEVIIMGPTTGVVELALSEIRVDLEKTEKTVKGESFSIAVPERIRRGDKLYKLVKNQPENKFR